MAGPDTLVGATAAPAPVDKTAMEATAVTAQVRSLHIDLDNLAMQYPDMAQACNTAKQALTDAMVAHMANTAQQPTRGLNSPPGM